jgi:photosystem II stability/assembly factor-like uncharacterized protein
MRKILFICATLLCNTVFAQWTSLNGFNGGYVRSIAINGNNIVTGSDSTGVSVSSDNGKNWVQVKTAFNKFSVNALKYSGTVLFAGTGTGIYKSADNGLTWTNTSGTIIGTSPVNCILVNGSSIYVGMNNGGVYVSSNAGTDWKAANIGLPSNNITGLGLKGTKLFAVVKYSGLYTSSDLGSTWAKITSIGTSTPISFSVNGTTIYAGIFSNYYYKSTDDGATWVMVDTKLPSIRIRDIAFAGNKILLQTDSGVYFSIDNETTWTLVTGGLSTNVSSMGVNGSTIFVGSYFGNYRSIDGG